MTFNPMKENIVDLRMDKLREHLLRGFPKNRELNTL